MFFSNDLGMLSFVSQNTTFGLELAVILYLYKYKYNFLESSSDLYENTFKFIVKFQKSHQSVAAHQ